MSCWRSICCTVAMALWLIFLSGCFPTPSDQADEQRDPHFLAGKAHLNTLNYRAAAESFEKALEKNPHNASAHFELGLLYEQKLAVENAPAIAIYHFDKYLQLRPNSEHSSIIRQKILACKREIAKPFTVEPGAQSYIREYERLKAENAQLRSQLELWQVYYSNLMARGQGVVVPAGTQYSQKQGTGAGAAAGIVQPGIVTAQQPLQTTTQTQMTYKVQAGDTLSAIAKKHGVSLKALTEANPGVDSRRLKIGQTINIPAKNNR